MDEQTRKALAFDLAYALRHRVAGKALVKDERQAMIVANQLVAHLDLCRWKVERLPPVAPHSAGPKR